MKTSKTRIMPGLFVLAVSFSMMLTSCSKDEPDIRDEVIGQYGYTLKIYAEDGNDLVYIGDQGDNYDISGTMRVVKNSGDLDLLDFYDGNVLMFHGTNVHDAGNAIVFDVPTQDAWIGPTQVFIDGYTYWDVDNVSYDGAFLYSDKSLEIAFTARIMNAETGLVMILLAFPK